MVTERRTQIVDRIHQRLRSITESDKVVLVAVLVIFTGAIAELEFERDRGNITTAEDALWWAMTTITTVGSGDRYPTTTEGRLVAVGLFGTLSGLAASWFTQPDKEEAGRRSESA
jgi:voltage-gated potassium channel